MILASFYPEESESRRRYKAFVEQTETTGKSPLKDIFGQSILSGEEFLNKNQ